METFSKAVVQPTTPPTVPSPASGPKKNDLISRFKELEMQKKVLIGVVGGLIVILFLLFLVSASKKKPVQNIILPSPIPTVSDAPSPVPQQISAFGQTSQFQQFESTLGSLKKDITDLDLNESQLAFPFLDMQFNPGSNR